MIKSHILKITTAEVAFCLLSCTDGFFSEEKRIGNADLSPGIDKLSVNPNPPSSMTGVFSASLSQGITNVGLYAGTYSDQAVFFDFNGLLIDQAISHTQPYMPNFDYSGLRDINMPGHNDLDLLPSQIPGVHNAFSSQELYYLNIYFKAMANAKSKNSVRTNLLNINFALATNSQNLNEEQLWKVKTIISMGDHFAERYFNNAVVPQVTSGLSGAWGRSVSAPCINFKSVWQSAVFSGFAAGTVGAIVGASGGTVVLPGVGTVTGGVGGAVFGFTNGFVGGALYSIGEQAFFKCLLGSTRQAVGIPCEDPTNPKCGPTGRSIYVFNF